MAEIYKFFNSTDTDKRTYQASDFADYFDTVLSTGLISVDENAGLEVTHIDNLNVNVSAGKAIMKGHLYENTSDLSLDLNVPETDVDRIDRIVLRLDLSNEERSIKLDVLRGTPADSPKPPALTRGSFVHELSLAQVYLERNTSSVGSVTDERLDESLCGLASSLITVPTSQFEAEWDSWLGDTKTEWQTWFDDVQQESPASQAEHDALQDEVTAHKAENALDDDVHGLADKVIEESGSNDDGEFVRYADGTQICWINELDSEFIQSDVQNTWASAPWSYPASFVSGHKIVIYPESKSDALTSDDNRNHILIFPGGKWFSDASNRHTSRTYFFLYMPATAFDMKTNDDSKVFIRAVAIGRWK